MGALVGEVAPPERRLTLTEIVRALDRLGPEALVPRTRMPRRSFGERLAALCERLVSARDARRLRPRIVAADVVIDVPVVATPITIPAKRAG